MYCADYCYPCHGCHVHGYEHGNERSIRRNKEDACVKGQDITRIAG